MRKIILILGLLATSAGLSQTEDAMLWTGASADMDITKDLSVEIEAQSRFSNNMSILNQAYGELGVGYNIVKGVKVGVVYRYSRKNEGDYFYNENRFCLDASYKYKLDLGLDFRVRARYQHSFDRLSAINSIYPQKKNIFRLGFKVSYKHDDFKLIEPFLAIEFFHAIQPANSSSFIDTYRFRSGLTFDLPKRNTLSVFYAFEHENRSVDNNIHIYGIQYGYSFKGLHKRKKKKSDK
jgi:hypothetical protein